MNRNNAVNWLLSLLILCLAPSYGWAETSEGTSTNSGLDSDGEFTYDLSGRVRFRHQLIKDFQTDRTAEQTHGLEQTGEVLARWKPSFGFGKWLTTKVTLDLWNGQAYGDESSVAEEALLIPYQRADFSFNQMVREAYIDAFLGIGRLRVGRMASHWGLGILANDGDREPAAFADASHGDISNRALFSTRPLGFLEGAIGESLFLLLGGDWVEQDELTNREDGDTTLQGVGALLWRTDTLEAGTYAAYRHLRSDSNLKTTALANDAYVKWNRTWENTGTLELKTEWALIQGETEELRFLGAPYPIDIFQFGGAAEATWTPPGNGLLGLLKMGWAPGDNSPRDGVARSIRFDPGYKVGMILFEEVMGHLTAQAHVNASDPELVAVPPQGVDRVPTNGAVHNAVYLFPQVGYRTLSERLEVQAGVLAAFSSGDVTDPFSSALFGGYNRNTFDKEQASGYLGTETLLGASFRQPELLGSFGVRVGVEAGLFIPGDALSGPEGEDLLGNIHKVRFLTDLFW